MDKRKVFIFGIILVVVALIIGGLIIFKKGGSTAPPPPPPTQGVALPEAPPPPPPPPPKIMVAAKDKPANTILTQDDLMVKVMPKPWKDNYVEDANLQSLVGRIIKTPLKKGRPVLDADLFQGEKFSYVIPAHLRAVPIAVTEQSSIMYMIEPGDRVDVLCVFPPTYTDQVMTRILIQSARVLSVGKKFIPDSLRPPPPPPPPDAAAGGAPPPPPTEINYNYVVLGVSAAEAEKLVLAEKVGETRLFLRGDGSTGISYTQGSYKSNILTENYFNEYLKESSKDRETVEMYAGTKSIADAKAEAKAEREEARKFELELQKIKYAK